MATTSNWIRFFQIYTILFGVVGRSHTRPTDVVAMYYANVYVCLVFRCERFRHLHLNLSFFAVVGSNLYSFRKMQMASKWMRRWWRRWWRKWNAPSNTRKVHGEGGKKKGRGRRGKNFCTSLRWHWALHRSLHIDISHRIPSEWGVDTSMPSMSPYPRAMYAGCVH